MSCLFPADVSLILKRYNNQRVFRGYLRLVGNKQFFLLTLAFAVIGLPFFAFIAVSSNVYINVLGYSERKYGYFFTCNASAFMIAPLLFSRIARHVRLTRLLPVSYAWVLIASVPMLASILPQPFRLAVPMWFLLPRQNSVTTAQLPDNLRKILPR